LGTARPGASEVIGEQMSKYVKSHKAELKEFKNNKKLFKQLGIA